MLQQIIAGLEAGSVYALIGLAIVVVVKATDVPNFAQAEIGLFAAYLAADLAGSSLASYVLAVAVGLAVGALIGWAMEFILIRPIFDRAHTTAVLMGIGLLFVINEVTAQVFGSRPRTIDAPWSGDFEVAGNAITWNQVVTVAVGVGAAFLLTRFFRSSRGAQMRALAEDRITPRLLGVSRAKVFGLAWAIGGVLSALAMILQGQSTLLQLSSAEAVIIKGFVGATLGGFSSVSGAFIGGLALGVLENLAGRYISTASQAAVALLAVVVVLMWKPRGLLSPPKAREV